MMSQIEDKVILETFLRWVRTSANFEEVPWLIFWPEVPKLPGVRNTNVSNTFLTAESFSVYFNVPNMLFHFMFMALLRLFYVKKQFVCILSYMRMIFFRFWRGDNDEKISFSSDWVRMRWTSGRLFKSRNGHFHQRHESTNSQGWG